MTLATDPDLQRRHAEAIEAIRKRWPEYRK
jgi:hypothetical protein